MNKNTTTIIIAIVLIIGAFYGGMRYGQHKIATGFRTGGMPGAFANGNGTRTGARGMLGQNGGLVSGEILSKDATSITVKMRDGGSKIVLISETTPVMKSASGKISDLIVGEQITATGTANPDGSIVAQSVQIRPATTTPAR
ncbi:MAG: hypothetical protein V4473_01095 [Patescibacteria group bacterium]